MNDINRSKKQSHPNFSLEDNERINSEQCNNIYEFAEGNSSTAPKRVQFSSLDCILEDEEEKLGDDDERVPSETSNESDNGDFANVLRFLSRQRRQRQRTILLELDAREPDMNEKYESRNEERRQGHSKNNNDNDENTCGDEDDSYFEGRYHFVDNAHYNNSNLFSMLVPKCK